MKLSSILCASIVLLGAAALISDAAVASKSNFIEIVSKRGTQMFPNGESDCIKQGGRVTKMCVMPEGVAPADATTVSGSKSNGSEKTGTPAPAPATAPAPGSPQ